MDLNKKRLDYRYKVEWTEIAKKNLDKLDNSIKEQILTFFKKENLLSAPENHYVIALLAFGVIALEILE
jgi:mRNA-degrading endonuclease RelE of RelBE toxin-antitoxin system